MYDESSYLYLTSYEAEDQIVPFAGRAAMGGEAQTCLMPVSGLFLHSVLYSQPLQCFSPGT